MRILKLLNNYYKNYSIKRKTYIFFRDLLSDYELWMKVFKETKSILDIGCGYGIALAYLLDYYGSQKEYTGIDIDINRIEQIRANFNGITNFNFNILNFDIENISELNKKFDGILFIDAIHYFGKENQIKILNDINNLLLPSGYFIFRFVNKKVKFRYIINYLYEFFSVKIFNFTKTRNAELYSFDENFYFDILVNLGFNIIVKYPSLFNPFTDTLFICQKNC